MIFKKLFSPSHKSTDPETRIKSISGLDKTLEKDKVILHELAFNDESEKVSLVALEKLDSFALWMKASETSNSQRIKKKAQHVCIDMLESPEKVDEKLFAAYIQESKSKTMQETLLFSSQRLQADTSLALSILLNIDNDNLTRRFFADIANTSQQQAIISKTTDAKTLSRYLKYIDDEALCTLVEDKLLQFQEAKEKPAKIKQQATLINSRLLALKDASDYDYLKQQFNILNKEFDTLKSDFRLLDELSSASLSEKYLGLKVSIQQKLAELEVNYLAQKLLQNTTNVLSDIENRCDDIKVQINLLISQADENNVIDVERKILEASLQEASEELLLIDSSAQTAAHRQQIKKIKGSIEFLFEQISQAKQVIELAQEAKEISANLLTQLQSHQASKALEFSAIPVLNDVIASHKTAFNEVNTRANSLLPSAVVNEFSKALSDVSNVKKGLEAELKKIEGRCQSKLKTVQNMIVQGKFKPALSTFHKVQVQYEVICEHANKRLQKSFELAKDEVIKLKEWQAYIAQPRKPELIEEVKSILSAEFTDPYQRAEQVKRLRAQWNSLGKLYTQEDDQHNADFDELIEKAFLPCRVFFAELDKMREANFQKASALIEQAKQIDKSLEPNELSKALSRLRREFNQVGEIDRDKNSKLKREFSKVLKPLNDLLSDDQKKNAIEKEKLVKQATKLLDGIKDKGELSDAVAEAKGLQQKWKKIGFAGKNDDNQLWQSFREINDTLFARYHDDLSEQKSVIESQKQTLLTLINSVIEKIQGAEALSELQFYDQAHAQIVKDLGELDVPSQKKLQSKISKMEDIYQGCVSQMTESKKAQALASLFDFLSQYTSETIPDTFDDLLGRYKTWIKGGFAKPELLQDLTRTELAQVAAILSEVEHSDIKIGTEKSRKELQLKLMASKLEGNHGLSPEDALAAWVSQGPLRKSDLTLVKKLSKLYIS